MIKNSITLILTLIYSNVFGNGWLQTGAHWHTLRTAPIVGTHEIHYEYTNDTTINSKVYQKVINQFTETFLFRTSNDSVFIIKDNGQEKFVWNTNPSPGDVWVLAKDQSNVEWCVEIDTVISEVINGQTTKWIFPVLFRRFQFSDIRDYTPCETYMWGYAKKFNSLFGPTSNFRWVKFDPTEPIIFGQDERLCFFETDSVQMVSLISSIDPFEFINCGSVVTSINQNNSLDIVIYPNPTVDKFFIKDVDVNYIIVTNMSGNEMFRETVKVNEPIFVNNLPSGHYIINTNRKKLFTLIKN